MQARLAAALGDADASAPALVARLVASLPGVAAEHAAAGVDAGRLPEFAQFLFASHGERLDKLSPTPFASADEILAMLTRPVDTL